MSSATTAWLSGRRRACSSKSAWTVPGAAHGPAERLQALSICSRSAALSSGSAVTGVSGDAAAAASRVASWPASRRAVAASKRSARYSIHPAIPSPSGASSRLRSSLAVPLSTGRPRNRSPGAASSGAAVCTASITWNSGVRPRFRSGASSSTSRSNGTLLVGVGGERRLPHPAQQLARRRLPG